MHALMLVIPEFDGSTGENDGVYIKMIIVHNSVMICEVIISNEQQKLFLKYN